MNAKAQLAVVLLLLFVVSPWILEPISQSLAWLASVLVDLVLALLCLLPFYVHKTTGAPAFMSTEAVSRDPESADYSKQMKIEKVLAVLCSMFFVGSAFFNLFG